MRMTRIPFFHQNKCVYADFLNMGNLWQIGQGFLSVDKYVSLFFCLFVYSFFCVARDWNQDQSQLRTGSKSHAIIAIICFFGLINFFYRCWHIFLTVVHCKTKRSNSSAMLLKTCNKNKSWQRKKQLKAWLHFAKKHDKSASCNVCKMIIWRK